jgi:hypothetical protein
MEKGNSVKENIEESPRTFNQLLFNPYDLDRLEQEGIAIIIFFLQCGPYNVVLGQLFFIFS